LAKKACQLYKDIKGTAGEVKEVLDDLKLQFSKIQNPTPAQKMQYNAEVQRVQEIAKADPHDVYTEIGNQLGALMDAYDAISKAFIKEEANAKSVYKGDESIARRALKRILIQARLDAMLVEIREMMVYQAPKELGSLWSKFEEMWGRIVAEQEIALVAERRQAEAARWRRESIKRKIKEQTALIIAVLFIMLWFLWLMIMIRMSATYRGAYSSPWWSCVLC
jgi:hypothetical protein